VDVVDVALVADGRVSAVVAVDVGVIGVAHGVPFCLVWVVWWWER
jgi:uncharacterized membrane protein